MGIFASLLFLPACIPCTKPNAFVPTHYAEETSCDPGCAEETVNLAAWWEQFNDPLLTALIIQAIDCNYDVRLAREKICEARAVYGVDFSVLLPHVDSSVAFQRIRNSLTLSEAPFLGGKYVNYYRAGFDAFWEIDLFGKNYDKAMASAYEVAMAREESRNAQISIVSEVAVTYFSILSLQKLLEIAYSHIESEQDYLKIAVERHEAGLTSELDVFQAKGLLEQRIADVPTLTKDLYRAIYSLGVLIGSLPESLVNLFCTIRELPSASGRIPLGLPSELLCRRPDIRAKEFAMYAAGARLSSARKEIFPTISLEAVWGYATGFFTRWPQKESQQWSVFPLGSLPIFHGGEILSHIRGQTSVQKQAILAYQQSVLKALQEVESGLIEHFQEYGRIEALEKEVKAYKEARSIALSRYASGLVDFLNVIETERDLFISQNRLTESEKNLLTSLVSIYKALGGGWGCCD